MNDNSKRGLLPKEVVDQIFLEVEIDKVIANYVSFEIKGKSLKGVCPFCNSENSFVVTAAKNIFKCFTCKRGGNVINFLMQIEHLDYPQVLRTIQNRFLVTSSYNFPIQYPCSFGTVFILKLEGGKYFVGWSNNFDVESTAYLNGRSNAWIRAYPFVKIMKIYNDKSTNFANYIVASCIDKFGIENVRGGDWYYFQKHIN